MLAHRQKVPDGSGTAKALDYSLKRWEALTRYLDDGAVPIDNNWVENQTDPTLGGWGAAIGCLRVHPGLRSGSTCGFAVMNPNTVSEAESA